MKKEGHQKFEASLVYLASETLSQKKGREGGSREGGSVPIRSAWSVTSQHFCSSSQNGRADTWICWYCPTDELASPSRSWMIRTRVSSSYIHEFNSHHYTALSLELSALEANSSRLILREADTA